MAERTRTDYVVMARYEIRNWIEATKRASNDYTAYIECRFYAGDDTVGRYQKWIKRTGAAKFLGYMAKTNDHVVLASFERHVPARRGNTPLPDHDGSRESGVTPARDEVWQCRFYEEMEPTSHYQRWVNDGTDPAELNMRWVNDVTGFHRDCILSVENGEDYAASILTYDVLKEWTEGEDKFEEREYRNNSAACKVQLWKNDIKDMDMTEEDRSLAAQREKVANAASNMPAGGPRASMMTCESDGGIQSMLALLRVEGLGAGAYIPTLSRHSRHSHLV